MTPAITIAAPRPCRSRGLGHPQVTNDAEQTVYHPACAVQLATDIMVDLFTFFSPPAPYDRLFVLCAPGSKEDFQSLMESAPRQAEEKIG